MIRLTISEMVSSYNNFLSVMDMENSIESFKLFTVNYFYNYWESNNVSLEVLKNNTKDYSLSFKQVLFITQSFSAYFDQETLENVFKFIYYIYKEPFKFYESCFNSVEETKIIKFKKNS